MPAKQGVQPQGSAITIIKKAPEESKTSVLDIILSIVLFPLSISGCTSNQPGGSQGTGPKTTGPQGKHPETPVKMSGRQTIKEQPDLTPTEQKKLEAFLTEIYLKTLRGLAPGSIKTETLSTNPDTGEQLSRPITTVTASMIGLILTKKGADETKRDISAALAGLSAQWYENGKARQIEILSADVIVDHYGAELNGVPGDKIIILPTKVRITEE